MVSGVTFPKPDERRINAVRCRPLASAAFILDSRSMLNYAVQT